MELVRIENLELLARQVVEGFIIGLHKSPFHGFSVEFAEHRLYNPGDALKHIDWRVYGRTNKLFIKKFEEETNLRCCIAIDSSSSMLYPYEPQHVPNKLQYSCLAAASLFELLKRQLDASSLAIFNNEIESFTECRSSVRHYRMLQTKLEQLLQQRALQRTSEIANNLHLIADRMHRRSLIIVFSDFVDSFVEQEKLFSALQHLRYNKHEVILFHVMDGAKEKDFELDNRPYELIDMETAQTIKLQPAQYRQQYKANVEAWLGQLKTRCQQFQIDFVPIDMRSAITQVLNEFLLRRNKLL